MKLYVYDHCPYCVKARMIFAWKNVDCEIIYLLNDDEITPVNMIGQKMLPILTEDGQEARPESLEIVKYIDNKFDQAIMSESKNDSQLNKWLQEAKEYQYPLAMPRWIEMGLEEFSTKASVAYFTKKKEDYIGSFSEHRSKTQFYIERAHQHLSELENIVRGDTYFWGECSEDDLHVFAALRCLTTVKGLKFPNKINTYMNNLSSAAKVPLHWDKAL